MEQGTSAATPHLGGARRKLFVQAGQRIGRGVVLDAEIRIPYTVGRGKTARAARLVCDCGTEYVARIVQLAGKQPEVTSCGCLSREQMAAARHLGGQYWRGRRGHSFTDKTGQRFGKLVVLRLAESEMRFGKSKLSWICRCDCGTEVTVLSGSLSSRGTKSCGCLCWAPRLPPGRAARNRLRKAYMQGARKRGLPWELSDDEFGRLTSQDCFYCGCKPSAVTYSGQSEYVYNGIDRVDNTLGYTLANAVTACTVCNNAKKDMSYDDFLAWIARLTEYHFFHPDLMPSLLLRKAQEVS